jgi:hypothetical protein
MRLSLDPLSLDDAGELFEAPGDPEVMSLWDWPEMREGLTHRI